MKKISNMQTKDMVAEAIRNEILSGGMEAGEELAQEQLAEIMGISRMPVREALQMLEQEGYIERLPNRHMAVVSLDAVKIKGIVGMIAAMETEIAIQGSTEESKEPERFLELMKASLGKNNTEKAVEWELEYHYSLVRLLENTYLEQLFSKALNGYVSYMIQKGTRDLAQRYELLESVNQKRKERDQETIRKDIQTYYQVLFESWERKE